jgi:hypothetical protein
MLFLLALCIQLLCVGYAVCQQQELVGAYPKAGRCHRPCQFLDSVPQGVGRSASDPADESRGS